MRRWGWWESKGLQPFFINPNGGAPRTDCDFQLWSWSALAHWVQTDPKTRLPLVLLLPTYDDLKPGPTVAATIGPRTLVLRPRSEKPKSIGSFEQAGPGGVLVDQTGRAVYYATHMENTSGGSRYPGKVSHIILSVLKPNPAIFRAQ
jgi:hypothetical protein